jgi:hypothetical protein
MGRACAGGGGYTRSWLPALHYCHGDMNREAAAAFALSRHPGGLRQPSPEHERMLAKTSTGRQLSVIVIYVQWYALI